MLFAVAVATRVTRIGDAAIHMDEQYYLLIADRMWDGALLTYFGTLVTALRVQGFVANATNALNCSDE